MRVIEQYFGPVRRTLEDAWSVATFDPSMHTRYYGCENECYIKVEVNKRFLHVKNYLPREVPAKVALREGRRALMAEIEREVFGD